MCCSFESLRFEKRLFSDVGGCGEGWVFETALGVWLGEGFSIGSFLIWKSALFYFTEKRWACQCLGIGRGKTEEVVLFGLVCLDAEFDDFFDEIEGKRLVDGKLDGAFGRFIGSELGLECFDGDGCGVEADVVFVGSEMDKIPIEVVGGHLIADFFLRLRGGLLNGLPEGLKNGLNGCGKGGDIFIDSGEFLLFWHGVNILFL